jgi:hypothetical protein
MTCPPIDQRGFARPLGGVCDIGSREIGPYGILGAASEIDTATQDASRIRAQLKNFYLSGALLPEKDKRLFFNPIT